MSGVEMMEDTSARRAMNNRWYAATSLLSIDCKHYCGYRISWIICREHAYKYGELTTEEERINYIGYLAILEEAEDD